MDDIWLNIFTFCPIHVIRELRSVSTNFKNVIDNDFFWKKKLIRDYVDIKKLKKDSWKKYYQKRFTNYGYLFQATAEPKFQDYTLAFKIGNVNHFRFNILIMKACKTGWPNEYILLTKDKKLVIISRGAMEEIKLDMKIKDVCVLRQHTYILDESSNLYILDAAFQPEWIDSNVLYMIDKQDYWQVYYVTHKTYQLVGKDKKEVFDFPVLDCVTMRSHEMSFMTYITTDYKVIFNNHEWKGSYLQISWINKPGSIMPMYLNMDKRVCIPTKNGLRCLPIKHVKHIYPNCYVSEGGDLFHITESTGSTLIAKDVLYVDYVNNKEDFTYVGKYG